METVELTKLVGTLGRSSLQAGELVLMVLGIQLVLRGRLTPRWSAALWLLVVARLLLPISFATALSIFNVLPRWSTPSSQTVVAITAGEVVKPVQGLSKPVSDAPLAPSPTLSAPEELSIARAAQPATVTPEGVAAAHVERSGPASRRGDSE